MFSTACMTTESCFNESKKQRKQQRGENDLSTVLSNMYAWKLKIFTSTAYLVEFVFVYAASASYNSIRFVYKSNWIKQHFYHDCVAHIQTHTSNFVTAQWALSVAKTMPLEEKKWLEWKTNRNKNNNGNITFVALAEIIDTFQSI